MKKQFQESLLIITGLSSQFYCGMGDGERKWEREWEVRGCEITVCMWGWGWMQRKRRDRVRYLMHY